MSVPEPEDLSKYKNKDTLMESVRNERLERQREQSHNQDNGRTATPEPDTRRATSVSDFIHRAANPERSGEAQPVYGTDGSVEDDTGSVDGYGEQFRAEPEPAARGNGSTYQSERTGAKRRDTVKEVVGKYRRAFTSGGTRSSTGPTTPKERAGVAGRKLSDVEAAKLRPKLVQYILWQSEHMDQFIIATTRGHQEVEIWSTIDRADAEIIADFMIARGRTDVKAANAVRWLSTFIDRLKLGLIIGPRAYQTAMVYFARGISIR